VLVEGGRATGVVLAGGEELHAPVVVTAIHPRITFLEWVDRAELPADFVTNIERWKSRSGVGQDQPCPGHRGGDHALLIARE
jgi:hypothetical protein